MKLQVKKITSQFLCLMLILTMMLFATGCNQNNTAASDGASQTVDAEPQILGEGSQEFAFTVVDKDGNETHFTIRSDKEFVGEALMEHNLIAGEDGDFGLYVKTVNGITADYDKDQTYWAFYVNGEYATSGVDTTKITSGDSYSFKVEK